MRTARGTATRTITRTNIPMGRVTRMSMCIRTAHATPIRMTMRTAMSMAATTVTRMKAIMRTSMSMFTRTAPGTRIRTATVTSIPMTASHAAGHQLGRLETATVELEARILAKNDALAATNRAWFADRNILALNLVSSPGAGKTTLLERTIRDLRGELALFVIEGDQATANDGLRIRAAGAPVVQINTGAGCHLEADMVAAGLKELEPTSDSVVLIENVGNLVCPAMFDLGERAKVVVFSVTEGEDKPLKYPHMFAACEVMILNKVDLLPHLDFDVVAAIANAVTVNPNIAPFLVSAKSGEGLLDWYDWLRGQAAPRGAISGNRAV